MPDDDRFDPDAPATPPPLPDPLFISPAEAAALLGVSRQTVYDLLNEGSIVGKRKGSRRFVLLASVQAYAYMLPA